MGSHSVTCHPTEVRNRAFTPSQGRFSDPGRMQGWIDLCYVKADRLEIEPATWESQVQRRTTEASCETRKQRYVLAASMTMHAMRPNNKEFVLLWDLLNAEDIVQHGPKPHHTSKQLRKDSPTYSHTLTQPSTLNRTVKWRSAFGLSNNNKWRWWSWTVAEVES